MGDFHIVERMGYQLNRYTVRDRWMIDTANIGLFVWNDDSRGTKAGYGLLHTCWFRTESLRFVGCSCRQPYELISIY